MMTVTNTSNCASKQRSNDSSSRNSSSSSRDAMPQAPPYLRSSLIFRLSRRFHQLTSTPSLDHKTDGPTTLPSIDRFQHEKHETKTETEDDIEDEDDDKPKSTQPTLDELEYLQQRCRDMQAELDRYRERCEELEELCRDFQVTFLSSYLETQSTEREMRDVLRDTGLSCERGHA
ncbi:uncharacterized protein BDV17DRAFT_220879 [Aspergillus undulatus]|uniref:uncharacterized protein n=1 Tax=Aspergillus undulatus TaxID=1810928 RepID=UPI003CCD53CC